MEAYGEGDVLVSPLECMGWVYGRILGDVGGKFCSHTRFEVGDGFNIRFWHELWCGDIVLKEAFPILFGIVAIKDAFVATLVEVFGGAILWRVTYDWEVETFCLVCLFVCFFFFFDKSKRNFIKKRRRPKST
jgi:hypothetical protein